MVAVITYTGYDMEDAMIINKGSYERGFGHGVVYKTKVVQAAPKGSNLGRGGGAITGASIEGRRRGGGSEQWVRNAGCGVTSGRMRRHRAGTFSSRPPGLEFGSLLPFSMARRSRATPRIGREEGSSRAASS